MVSLFCPLPQTTGPSPEGPSERRAGDGEGACGFALDHTPAFPPIKTRSACPGCSRALRAYGITSRYMGWTIASAPNMSRCPSLWANRDILVHPPMPATPPSPLGPRVFRLTPIYLRGWQDVALFSSLLPVPCRRCLFHHRALVALGEGRLPGGDGAG